MRLIAEGGEARIDSANAKITHLYGHKQINVGNEALWELPVNACYRELFTCNRDVITRVKITAALCATRDALLWFL